MDRAVVIATLVLIGLTWLLYKLAALLEPKEKPRVESPTEAGPGMPDVSASARRPIHQRLRQ